MSANEQIIWYLASIIAKVEGMTAELVAARGGDPSMATSLVEPAPPTATSTSAAAPVVLHTNLATTPAPPTDLGTAMLDSSTPSGVTFSACDDQFTSTAPALCPVPAVDLQPAPDTIHCVAAAPAMAAHSKPDKYTRVEATLEVTTEPPTPPVVSSSPTKAQEILDVPHGAFLAYITIATLTCSMDCSNQVLVASSLQSPLTTSQQPAATPALVTDPDRPIIDVDSSMRGALVMDGMLPTPQAAPVVLVVKSLALSVDHDLDVSMPAEYPCFFLRDTPMPSLMSRGFPYVTNKWLVLRPTPWPLFWMVHEEANEV